MVLLHPASQSGQIWEHQLADFAAAGFRAIAYSRRGYLGTGTGTLPGTSVGDLLHLLDALAIRRTHLLGAAAGGITAMAFAVAHADRVKSLILSGSIVEPNEQIWRDMYERLGMAHLHAVLPTTFAELGPAYRASQPEGVQRFAALSAAARPGGRIRQPVGARATWAAMEQLRVPALFLTGEADLYCPPPLQALIASHLPGSEQVTLPAVGHAAYWEQPALFNRLVLEFLSRHR